MNEYEIVLESTCDLNKEIRKKFNIYPDYIHSIVYFPEQDDMLSDMDYNNFTPKQYFTLVKRNVGRIKTAFASFEEFKRVIEPILKEEKDVIIPVISSAMSGTYQGFNQYKEELLSRYKERKIYIVDTLKYSSAEGLLAIYLAINRDEKMMSYEENIAWVEEYKHRLHEIGPMDDLSFLAKNGRISAPKAFFGGLANVNPIADFTSEGMSSPLGTISGDKKANEISLSYLLETIKNSENQIIVITHSDRYKRAEEFKRQLSEKIKVRDIIITNVGESCGPNIGPGLCCYFYLGDKISDNQENEKAIFARLSVK